MIAGPATLKDGDHAKIVGGWRGRGGCGRMGEGWPVAKLMWRVMPVAGLRPGVAAETGAACVERDEEVGVADPGLRPIPGCGRTRRSG